MFWVALIVAWVLAEGTDPKDPNVGLPSANKATGPWCFVCNVNVHEDSKHCWDCGKCVENFDHHCPWLNNCVGARTYRAFLAAVWSLLGMLSVIVATTTLLVLRSITASGEGDQLSNFLVGLLLIIAAVHIPLWCLDVFLAGFHCLLWWRGLTTYQYLTGKQPSPARCSSEPDTMSLECPDNGETMPPLPKDSSGISKGSKNSRVSSTSIKKELSGFVFGSSVLAADPWVMREQRRMQLKSDGQAPSIGGIAAQVMGAGSGTPLSDGTVAATLAPMEGTADGGPPQAPSCSHPQPEV